LLLYAIDNGTDFEAVHFAKVLHQHFLQFWFQKIKSEHRLLLKNGRFLFFVLFTIDERVTFN
jgi:hypothetical protein